MIHKTYKAYLFDFDYTLADSSRGIVMCFRNVLAMHGHDGISDESIKRTIGKTLEESFTILTGIDDKETLAAYRKEYVAQADRLMTANTVLFPETLDVLSRLKERGARIGIISTKYRYRIMELLGKKLPEGFLDIIVGGEDVKTPKPSPEGLKFAISHLGLEAAEVLYCGDSTVDAETARNAGVDFAGVLHGMTTREELEAYPHAGIVTSLDGIL
ncbi:HAD family hydrolase [uncultured Bacteroides sp.]|uniref:HAD family hydrolase n=1 Tax=uncultured Bacteroides sp. TaxID=162156 RepID=UPI002612737A|nr:HAD-IA family hydrolase [uncultured Bacteroides sp.]